MGFNEAILIVTGALSASLVLVAWRVDRERVYTLITIFLILIAIAGGKIVSFFGHLTNTGNVFYASIFVATYFLIERYGKKEAERSVWVGISGAFVFLILLQTVVLLRGSEVTVSLNTALATAFATVPRTAFASLLAYTVSQTINIQLYVWLKNRFGAGRVWLRANAANAVAQLLDSIVFFTIAFWGVDLPTHVVDILLTGFIIKVLFVMLASPLLSLNHEERHSEGSYSAVTRW